jgi:hypothetical protein
VTAAIAFGAGLAAGIVLELLTFALARYGPSGSDAIAWSFRGNGALIVPFGLGPAVLAGGWTALVLHGRSGVRWLSSGIAAGLIGGAIVLASAFATMLGTSTGFNIANALTVAIVVWMIAAPALALILFRAGEYQPHRIQHVVAEILFAVGVLGGFFAAQQVLPPGA